MGPHAANQLSTGRLLSHERDRRSVPGRSDHLSLVKEKTFLAISSVMDGRVYHQNAAGRDCGLSSFAGLLPVSLEGMALSFSRGRTLKVNSSSACLRTARSTRSEEHTS